MGAEVGESGLALWLVIAIVPLLLAACTAFAKLSIVLSALRVGLSAEALLPYGIVLALAVVLTALVMGPTAVASYDALIDVGGASALTTGGPARWLEVAEPLLSWMRRHAHPQELAFFSDLVGLPGADPRVLVSAFLVSELAEAVQMVALLLIPFVLIDLIVAQVLALLDMPNLPPKTIALPAKLLLFLSVGGWDMLIQAVVGGYA